MRAEDLIQRYRAGERDLQRADLSETDLRRAERAGVNPQRAELLMAEATTEQLALDRSPTGAILPAARCTTEGR